MRSAATESGDDTEAIWLPSSPRPPEEGEVTVWRVRLDVSEGALAALRRLLSPDERDRAARFRFEEHRRGFIACRGSLRAILGGCLERDPAVLAFDYVPYGRPELTGEQRVSFNVSHSRDLALIAVAAGRRVGVDVEAVRADLASMEIAERFFSPAEVAVLRGLPEEQRLEAFFNCWTRKEAFIKALGEGLHCPLSSFDVSLAPGEPARLLSSRRDPADGERWSLRALDPGTGFKAAAVAEGHDWELACREWLGLAGVR